MDTTQSIIEKCKAGYAAIYMTSSEESRAIKEITDAAVEVKRDLHIWGHGKGLYPKVAWRRRTEDAPTRIDSLDTTKPLADTEMPPSVLLAMEKIDKPAIFVLRLFHHFMDDPLIQTYILDLLPEFKRTKRVLIVLSPYTKIPMELDKEFTLIESNFPTREELGQVLDGVLEGIPPEQQPDAERRVHLVNAARGLTTTEAGNAFSVSIIRPRLTRSGQDWDPNVVLEEKCHALKKTGMLEYIPTPTGGLQSVGGMDLLKAFVRRRQLAFSDEARAYGIPYPKGLLLIGPPGTGKSLGARAISAEMKLPLLRLDMGRVYGGIVGQSEGNIYRVLKSAEAQSPCVLWIDEIEKGMATGSGNLDSGVGQRVLGTVLTWMQEKTDPVYVYATANKPNLPPELMRKGRFDEMFSVDLPNPIERAEIFRIHLAKVNRLEALQSDVHSLASTSDGYQGSEIEAALHDAMLAAFSEGREVMFRDIVDAIHSTQPQSKIMSEEIKRIRDWCASKTRPASSSYREEVPVSVHSRQLEA